MAKPPETTPQTDIFSPFRELLSINADPTSKLATLHAVAMGLVNLESELRIRSGGEGGSLRSKHMFRALEIRQAVLGVRISENEIIMPGYKDAFVRTAVCLRSMYFDKQWFGKSLKDLDEHEIGGRISVLAGAQRILEDTTPAQPQTV